jgi:LPS-assembly lipoprotein
LLLLAGCGFQLRGTGQAVTWPEQLQQLQLRFDGSVDSDFRASLRNSLIDRYGVEIVKEGVAQLVISGVARDRRVLSLSATGKVSEYLLRFQVSFAVVNATGDPLIKRQTVRLQRDFSFDNTNILAKEVEERRLSEQMQNDAVRRILRRMTALTRNQ